MAMTDTSTGVISTDRPRDCGHAHHVGTCPCCQRAQLARWHDQLEQASSDVRDSLAGRGLREAA